MRKLLFFIFCIFTLPLNAFSFKDKELCRNGTFSRDLVVFILNSNNVLKESYLRYGNIPEEFIPNNSYENLLMLRNPAVELGRIRGCKDVLLLIEKVVQEGDLIDSDFKVTTEEKVQLFLDVLISRKVHLSENSIRAVHKKYPKLSIFRKLRTFPACPKDIAEKYINGLSDLAQYTESTEIIDKLLEQDADCLYSVLKNINIRERLLRKIYERINQYCLSEGGSSFNYTSLRSLCEHPSLTEPLAQEILRSHPSSTVRKYLIANMNLPVAFRLFLIKTSPENFFYDTALLSDNYALFGEYNLAPCDYDELIQTEIGAFFVAGATDTPEDVIRDMKKWPSTWYALLQNKKVSKNYLLEHGSFCLHVIKKIYDVRSFKVDVPENMNDVVSDLYFEEMKNTLMFFPNKSWELQDRLFECFKEDSDLIPLLIHSPSISPKVTDFFVQNLLK